MKLTDLSIIFVIILLPFIMIVYVNTSFVIKAEKEEMYYKKVIDSALRDATEQMKQIENSDITIDYGYSGIVDNKVSINAKVAVNTFYNSLFNTFNIQASEGARESFKKYIPVIAVFDYDGVYINSAEELASGEIEYILKPKQYYTYTYGIKRLTGLGSTDYVIVDGDELDTADSNIVQITFTMDDYIYVDVYANTGSVWNHTNDRLDKKHSTAFYLSDASLNGILASEEVISGIASDDRSKLLNKIIDLLGEKRKQTIINVTRNTITEAVNRHNNLAEMLGIKYNFNFTIGEESDWYENIEGIGMLAVVQGISLGNRFLNYNGYSMSSLILSKKYYISKKIIKEPTGDVEYLNTDMYHVSEKCPIYKEYIFRNMNEYTELSPKFYYNKAEAGANEYTPCPVCKP